MPPPTTAHQTFLNAGAVTLPATGDTRRLTFLGEIGLVATLCITKRASLRGGYNVLWVDGVTLASDQIPVTNFIIQTGIDSKGDVFYHGGFAGLEFTY